jgi:hypothetical protein
MLGARAGRLDSFPGVRQRSVAPTLTRAGPECRASWKTITSVA